jgi:chaperone BCS1
MYLQHTVSKIPKMAILLIEDIDCAFPVREDEEPTPQTYPLPHIIQPQPRRCLVTLSGLLNMIDGIGSEEGKLFFATVGVYLSAST